MNTNARSPLPRTLVLSFSGIDSESATGQLLGHLFRDWPDEDLLQIYWAHHPGRAIGQIDAAKVPEQQIIQAVRDFAPQAIYLRPADTKIEYCQLASKLIQASEAPLMTHTMDDWSCRVADTEEGQWLLEDLQQNFRRARFNLTICPEMSEAYSTQYRTPFASIANGIDPAVWKNLPSARKTSPFVIRYCGALADDMQRQSVSDIGKAVKSLADSGRDIRLEIYTMPWFQKPGQEIAEGHPAITVSPLVEAGEYPALLAGANAVLLCYNFDPVSREYTRYSFANKTPECLASGAPVLTYGPPEIPSIAYISQRDLGVCVTERDQQKLQQTIAEMLDQPEKTAQTAHRAKAYALERHAIARVRQRFANYLRLTAGNADMSLREYTRDDDIAVDETAVVHAFFAARGKSGTMIDVGAHHGSAFKQFLDDGWDVHAFEPDPNNRAYIQERWQESDRFHLTPNAVGNVSGEKLNFYAADQSTGISSLVPFHENHKVVDTVETVRLDDYLNGTTIAEVDFLKIDTEGFDLRVLQGFPWDRFKPAVIECEYEDAKTLKIDYDYRELAQFLVDHGYQVFMSEWHPIVRYGIRHQWCRLVQWPAEQKSDQSWGNFLAFREPIEESQIASLFMQHILEKNPGKLAPPVPEKPAAEKSSKASEQTRPEAPAAAPAPAATPTPTPKVTNMPASNPIANHARIFFGFLGSTQGVISLLLVVAAMGAPFLADWLAAEVDMAWLHWLGPIVTIGAVLHLLAYTLERARFEAEHTQVLLQQQGASTGRLRQQLKLLEQKLAELPADAAKPEELQHLAKGLAKLQKDLSKANKDVDGLQHQYLDIKQKLPEIIQMIGNVRSESDAWK